MVVSLAFIPVVFGAVAVIMGYLYREKDEQMGTILMIAGVAGAIFGVLLGMSMSYWWEKIILEIGDKKLNKVNMNKKFVIIGIVVLAIIGIIFQEWRVHLTREVICTIGNSDFTRTV